MIRSTRATRRRFAPLVALMFGASLAWVAGPGCSNEAEEARGEPERSRLRPQPRDPWPSEITTQNLDALELAWSYAIPAAFEVPEPLRLAFEARPIRVADQLVFCTATGDVEAVDAETGAPLWRFDVDVSADRFADEARAHAGFSTRACRGVASSRVESDELPGPPPRIDGAASRDAAGMGAETPRACAVRIYAGTAAGDLYALDAFTGKPCSDFGVGGRVRLTQSLQHNSDPDAAPGARIGVSTPLVLGRRVIVGKTVAPSSDPTVDSPSGEIVAFDRITGALLWSFDPIPRDPRDPARLSWAGQAPPASGVANAWAGMVADVDRDLVFVPTSSPSGAGFGGRRLGENRRANSLVALKGSSGEVVWDFQAIHHDVWEYDLAAPPLLLDVERAGRAIPAIALLAPSEQVFLLDRRTGRFLWAVSEESAPVSDVPGELLAPTQPRVSGAGDEGFFPAPGAPNLPFGVNPLARMACERATRDLRNDGLFTPPTEVGSWILPGLPAVTGRGKLAWDPRSRRLFFNSSRVGHAYRLIPGEAEEARFEVDGDSVVARFASAASPYVLRVERLDSPFGAPCNPPPWGLIRSIAVDGDGQGWSVPLGTMRAGVGFGGSRSRGAANHGGPHATDSGLVFIAATEDRLLRVLDATSGETLREIELPGAGFATPMTYWGPRSRKQYVVVATTGGSSFTQSRVDELVAFAIPGSTRRNAATSQESVAAKTPDAARPAGPID